MFFFKHGVYSSCQLAATSDIEKQSASDHESDWCKQRCINYETFIILPLTYTNTQSPAQQEAWQSFEAGITEIISSK